MPISVKQFDLIQLVAGGGTKAEDVSAVRFEGKLGSWKNIIQVMYPDFLENFGV